MTMNCKKLTNKLSKQSVIRGLP